MTSTTLGYYWGDDEYGLEAAARRPRPSGGGARRRAAGALADDRRRPRGPREIAERVATATLFGGGTLVIVEDPGPLVRAKADRDALLATIGDARARQRPRLRRAGRRDRPAARSRSRTWRPPSPTLGGEVRQVVAPREGGMARWIEERATERGMRLERGAAEALARKIGAFVREGDVDRRRQGRLAVAELEKLAVYRLDAPGPARRTSTRSWPTRCPGSTWAFLDAVGARTAREAADLLERLLETTPEPVLVAVLHRRIRELLLVADHRERGETIQATARALKLKEYPAQEALGAGPRVAAGRARRRAGGAPGAGRRRSRASARSDARRRRLAFSLWLAERVART